MASGVRNGKKLPRAFYARPTLEVAPALVGKLLCVRTEGEVRRCRVVETEAYVGSEDLACHASKKGSRRARTLYGPPGMAYVYFVYGMHHMLNAVTEPEGLPAAVLIRACEPAGGLDRSLSGPGRLCRALGIGLSHNGADLTGDAIWFEEDGARPPQLAVGRRVGVEYAGAWARKPWRFADAESRWVSRPRVQL